MPSTLYLSLRRGTALALLLLFPLVLGLAACSDQAPEPKPAAQAEPAAANATVDNATAAAPPEANATQALAAAEANATAGNATTAALPAANATLAACAPLQPEHPTAKAEKPQAKAEKPQAKAEKPQAKKAKATATATPSKKASSGALTPERAREEFMSFAQKWVATLSRNMLGNAARMAVTQDGGGYVARFAEVEKDSMEFEVKPTDSPSCPFVGVLKYFECSYESRGDSPEAAKSGVFSQVRKVRVTELFRHSGAKWE